MSQALQAKKNGTVVYVRGIEHEDDKVRAYVGVWRGGKMVERKLVFQGEDAVEQLSSIKPADVINLEGTKPW